MPQIDRQTFFVNIQAQKFRTDGRTYDECRPTAINVKSLTNVDGSAIVKVGKTTFACGIKAELAKPKAETPNEGYLVVNVELPPLCSPQSAAGPPGDEAQEATSFIERSLRITNALNLTDLCLHPGHLVWVIYVDLVCLNHDGGLLSAALCAAIAALDDTRLPLVKYDPETSTKTVDTSERSSLRLTCNPFASTFAVFSGGILMDPTAEEESMAEGIITAVVAPEPATSILYMPGCRPLEVNEIKACEFLAKKRAQHLSRLITIANESPER